MTGQLAGETAYYNDNGVLITNTRAVLGGTTYPLANVSSVGVGRIEPSGTSGLIILIVAVASFMCGLSTDEYRLFGIGLGVVLGVLAVVLLRAGRPSYYVKLGSAGGEQRALQGRSKEEVEKIVAALNEAIIRRG